MKLKRLDIHGFKSFYHRTTVLFDDGITGIVGPNGCGKSNIVDAIKWVMGEQGPKNLRGAAMEDVIFGGTGSRGPMGMCEVRLTFENDHEKVVGDVRLGAGQIELERRLERNKGSDYFINRRRVRLSDIQDLLAGTGVGAGPGGRRAYAIIEQGQIERIVGAKAEERRMFIEEAAGVTRYRQRRKLAERRMDETRLNLERVDDIVQEIERQLRSLRRQAKKAERFKSYRDEANQIAVRTLAEECQAFDAEQATLRASVKDRNREHADAIVAVQALETRRSVTQLDLKKSADRVAVVSDALRRAEETALLARERIAGHERERKTLASQLERAHVDLERGEGRRAEIELEQSETSQRLAELESQAQSQAADLTRAEQAKKDAVSALLTARSRVERLMREESEEFQAMAQARARVDVALRRQRELSEEKERALARQSRIQIETDALDTQCKSLEQIEASSRAEVDGARVAVESEQASLATMQNALSEAVDDEARHRDELIVRRSRLASLEELDDRGEGLVDAARALLTQDSADIIGQISELFTVPEALELPTAAALGSRLQGVLVASRDAARQHLARIVEDRNGRIVLACDGVELIQPTVPAPTKDGVLGYLADLLTIDAPRPIHRSVLDHALCVESLSVAHALVDDGWSGVIVTLAGERIANEAVMEAGASDVDAALLRRRREIAELKEAIPDVEQAHQMELERLSQLRQSQTQEREKLEASKVRLQKAEIERAKASKDVELADRESQRLAQVRLQLVKDVEGLQVRLENARSAEQEGRRELLRIESLRQDRRQSIEEAEELVRTTQSTRDEAVAYLHDIRARSMAREERVMSLKTVSSRLNRQLNEIEVRRKRVSEVGVDVQERLSELAVAEADDRTRMATAEADAEELARDLVQVKLALEASEDAQNTLAQEFDTQKQVRDDLRQAIGELQLQIQAVELRADNHAERLRDKYRVSVEEAVAHLRDVGVVTDEERARLSELTELLDKMGEVNLAAIEEFESVEERHVFLTEQRDDLLAGLKDLSLAIQEIDRESQTLFAETFTAVNGHFQKLFPRLFRGGEAELILQNPDDLLNTGIEMRVSPPGKKVQSVELMSGGEKAMCAIALIFAVFRHKPSPFCLLDEVDAPLDDANIGRFNDVVREIAQTSQIVLVTHNKRTMEIADVLYGVTMEESGVSKLVGVRMA